MAGAGEHGEQGRLAAPGRATIRPLGQPGDLGWIVQAHGELYAAEFRLGCPFRMPGGRDRG